MDLKERINISLIPAYEPDDKLINLVDILKKSDFEVVVIDDGSGKDYKSIFDKCKAKVISYPENQGKGHALKEGLKYIKEKYNNCNIVTMDSDGQHTVEDAKKLINYLKKHPTTLVLGSRKRGKNTPLRSFLGNSITRFVFSLATNYDIYDTQTGLRAFTEELVPYMLEVEGERFEYEMNVLLNAKRNNIKIKELAIKVIYIDNNSGSHFNAFKDSFKIYKEIIKFSLSSIFCFLLDYVLFIVFNLISNNIVLSNIFARIFSGFTNYTLNKRLVFKSTSKGKNELFKYILLAIIVLTFNTILVTSLSLVINKYISKIITEVILFMLSWFIQKTFIFKK